MKTREQHRLKSTPEYNSWCAMKQRCNYSKNKRYDRYGGRGITVCDRWNNSFLAFLEDMGKRPTTKHTLDRIDNEGNYEPKNCRWVTNIEQSNNRSGNVLVKFNGQSKTIRQWSLSTGIGYKTLRQRIFAYKWPVEKALTHEVREWSPIKRKYNV